MRYPSFSSAKHYRSQTLIDEGKWDYSGLSEEVGVLALCPLEQTLAVKINASKSPSTSIRSLCRAFYQ